MDAFQSGARGTIDGYYVDGISITSGFPRKHVWTFAIGLSIDHNYGLVLNHNCPCAKYPGLQPPSFVGNDYYCESAIHGVWQPNKRWLTQHRLWDGHCSSKSKCCLQLQQTGKPYFTKSLGTPTTENLEVRLCANGDNVADEDVGLERMSLCVR